MSIHPTAQIAATAALGAEVEVGPFCVIGGEAKIGEGSVLQSHVVIEGDVQIGRGNTIGHGTVIGGQPQDLSFKADTRSRVEIGDNNVVREHCTIHRGTVADSATIIGNGNFLMAGAHVGHNCGIGNDVIIANNCLLGGYVKIDDRAFLGGASVFHQHVQVGRLVMVQGQSGFSKDVPPFVIAAELNFAVGVNVIGLRRAGFSAEERDDIKRAFKLLYRSGLNTHQALDAAAKIELGSLAREFFAFVANATKRGVVAYPPGDRTGD